MAHCVGLGLRPAGLLIILQSMAHCVDLGLRPAGPHFNRLAYEITTEAVENHGGRVREVLNVQRKKFRLWVELGQIPGATNSDGICSMCMGD
ncbi:hypothetical protein B0T24DRAFT_629305 [Lasiosphaeria ovina]|uniref:Uncharacterized protein n=1 Tax=Lasiosphaeria ovina TaxID=92902 RepID=A0AAE0N623_9PEZI|nr:hypothetical protein B0T24DRAFT_629305 [Lasiosphaeria ovina]